MAPHNPSPKPEDVTIDLRSHISETRTHPLDPNRIGTEGLAARFERFFNSAVDTPDLVTSYTTMTRALVDSGSHDILVRAG